MLAEHEFQNYHEAWELLDGDADDVPDTMLPGWVRGWYQDEGSACQPDTPDSSARENSLCALKHESHI